MARKLLACLLLYAAHLSAAIQAPTEKYLEVHTLDEIKYNLRLDGTTLIYKDLFDKVISQEIEGFIGYHGDSLEYRIYQDVIRVILEEIVGIAIPIDFHFLDIPCFREQKLQELTEIPNFFLSILPSMPNTIGLGSHLYPILP